MVCFWQSSLILDIAAAPLPEADQALIVLAPTEAFMTTVTVCIYAAIIVAAPFISFQIFAYVLPAFSPTRAPRRAAARPGDPGAVHRRRRLRLLRGHAGRGRLPAQLQQRPVRAPSCGPGSTTRFFSTTLIAGGVVFQVPVIILALVRLRIVTITQLRKYRRYAYLIIAVIAAALPGVDPITMLIEMVPLLLLYELSILLARGFGATGAGESIEPITQEN